MKSCVLEIHIPEAPVPAYKKLPELKKAKQSVKTSKPLLTLPSGNYDPNFFIKYRSLIQKNYAKSVLKQYEFPRNLPNPERDQDSLSRHSSIDSMKGVLTYRLNNQNKKRQSTFETVQTQRVFADTRDGFRKLFRTTPKSKHSRITNRSQSPICFAGGESDKYIQARKTADKRIFFVYCTKYKQRQAGLKRPSVLTNRKSKALTAMANMTATR